MELNREVKLKAIKILREWGNRNYHNFPPVHAIGICGNLENSLKTRIDVCRYYKTWKYFSGDYTFPVTSFKQYLFPEHEYDYYWSWTENSEYMFYRRHLCLHIANEIEEELSQE